MSFASDDALTPSLSAAPALVGLFGGGVVSMFSLSLAVEQALLSPPVWSSVEVASVGVLALVGVMSLVTAWVCADRLDNRGGEL